MPPARHRRRPGIGGLPRRTQHASVALIYLHVACCAALRSAVRDRGAGALACVCASAGAPAAPGGPRRGPCGGQGGGAIPGTRTKPSLQAGRDGQASPSHMCFVIRMRFVNPPSPMGSAFRTSRALAVAGARRKSNPLQFAPLVGLAIRVVSDCLATGRWRVSRAARWGR